MKFTIWLELMNVGVSRARARYSARYEKNLKTIVHFRFSIETSLNATRLFT